MWGDEARREENRLLREIRDAVRCICEALQRAFPPAISATLDYSTQGGTAMSALALVIGQLATPTFTEFDVNGNVVAPIGPVTYAADPSGAISVDPNLGTVTALVPTATGAVATSTATDAGNGLSASATFTVTAVVPPPPVAVSATLTYVAGPVPASARVGAVRGGKAPGYDRGF